MCSCSAVYTVYACNVHVHGGMHSCVYVFTNTSPCPTDDYDEVSQDLTFNSYSGSLSQNVIVFALPDTVSGEGDEVFFLSLTEDDPAVMLMMSTANVTIIDASKLVRYGPHELFISMISSPAVVLGFIESSYTFTEGQMMANVVVNVTANPLSRSVLVAIMSVGGSATGECRMT